MHPTWLVMKVMMKTVVDVKVRLYVVWDASSDSAELHPGYNLLDLSWAGSLKQMVSSTAHQAQMGGQEYQEVSQQPTP